MGFDNAVLMTIVTEFRVFLRLDCRATLRVVRVGTARSAEIELLAGYSKISNHFIDINEKSYLVLYIWENIPKEFINFIYRVKEVTLLKLDLLFFKSRIFN